MMVCNTQNYWIAGLCPSSGILNTRKHNVSETGSVSVVRSGEGGTYFVGSLERGNLNHWSRDPAQEISPSLDMKTERDPVSETLCFLVFRIPDDDTVPKPSNSGWY
jgi:hypothetical protein